MRSVLSLLIVALLFPSIGLAQNTDIESLAGLQFSFGNPGARSLGMGGAFLALADDATAAEANPAGLTILRKPEISFEARNYRTSQQLATGGTYPRIESNDFSSFSRRAEPWFGSFVYPVGNNFAVAGYYHETINYENSADPFAIFLPIPDEYRPDPPRFYLPRGNPLGSALPVSRSECERIQRENPADLGACLQYSSLNYATAVEIILQTWGIAGAYQIGNVSFGASGRFQRFEEVAATIRAQGSRPTSVVVQGTLADMDSDEAQKESAFTWTAGFKWAATERLSFGGVYKKGPEFDTPIFTRDFDAATYEKIDDVKFHVPDVYGVGVSFRPIQPLTINADVVRVTYSNLIDDMRPINYAISVLDEPYKLDDVTEYRLGAEYFLSTRIPVAIRAGWWREPAHRMSYNGPLTCTDAAVVESERTLCSAIRINQAILFPEGKDQDHRSIGIGISWPRLSIDAAYDTSDTFKVGSISMVTRF